MAFAHAIFAKKKRPGVICNLEYSGASRSLPVGQEERQFLAPSARQLQVAPIEAAILLVRGQQSSLSGLVHRHEPGREYSAVK